MQPDEVPVNLLLRNINADMLDFVRYIKPYEGILARQNKQPENVRFYDEREWRYVPSLDKTHSIRLSKEEYLNPIHKAHADSLFEDAKLGFQPNDIRYLIIKDDTERSATIRALREIKAKYDPTTIDILTSRIMTWEQIIHDV